MKHAIEVIHHHGSKLPETMKAEAVMKYFYSFRNLETVQDILKPSIQKQMQQQLIEEEAEKKRLKELRTKALEKKREQEQLDLIMNAPEELPQELPSMPIGSREDLQNMILNLDRKYFTLNETIDMLQIEIKNIKDMIK
jgi:hypothetical protein